MFLEGKKSFGNYYINLRCYSVRENYSTRKETLYTFGRVDKALLNMYSWRNDFRKFPKELLVIGCQLEHLEDWIRTIETGVTKTGKQFKAAI